jgi:hypothetical protein
MSTLAEKNSAPICTDTQQISIAQVQEKDSLLLMPLLRQDLDGLVLPRRLSTLTMTQIKMTELFGCTNTSGNTLTYE